MGKKRPTFRAQLEGLTAEQLHAGAPALALVIALVEEVRRLGVIAAAAYELDHADLYRAERRLQRHERRLEQQRKAARGTRIQAKRR